MHGAKVWIRWDEDYMPKEWKKRESNNRRHILWKMEKFELQLRTGRFKFTHYYLTNMEIINNIEGENNCYNGYTSVGNYLKLV